MRFTEIGYSDVLTQEPASDGRLGRGHVPRQPAADRGFQFERPWKYNAYGDGGADRHAHSLELENAYETRTTGSYDSQLLQNVREVESHAKTRMDKVLTDLQHEMAGIRTGRASVSIFDNLQVDYYGTPTPINQVANLHVPEPTLITIQPWDVSQIARDREGHPRLGPGPESGQRRQDHPRADSGA